ncbi:MAG: NADH-quinone oxidoreductase subunit K [Bacteroidales bacterium]|nr:NADH-quinone oxidoreductase subunit K [Bacteroidales bacterium]
MIVFILCFILFLVGLFGLLTSRNIIKIIIGLSFMEFSVYLFLVLIGYIEGGQAPIVVEGIDIQMIVDPLPQAMVLTAIVIGLATKAMLLSTAIRIYKKFRSFDIRKIRSLKG